MQKNLEIKEQEEAFALLNSELDDELRRAKNNKNEFKKICVTLECENKVIKEEEEMLFLKKQKIDSEHKEMRVINESLRDENSRIDENLLKTTVKST